MFRRTSATRDCFEPTSPTSPRSTSSSRSLPPSPTGHHRSARILYQHPSGSRFLEDAVSAVLTSETGSDAGTTRTTGTSADVGSGTGTHTGTSTSVEIEVIPATLPASLSRLRTQPSRLQKVRRAPLPAFRPSPGSSVRVEERGLDSGSEGSSSTWTVASLPTPARSPAPGPLLPLSFCPTPHQTESFTEYDRLQVRSGEVPALVLLRTVAPEQSTFYSQLLHTSLPSNRDAIRDIIPRRNGFVDTVLEAYNNHRGFIVRPDDVWLAIVTQFSFFVHGHPEAARKVFVAHAHERRRVLAIETGGNRYSMDMSSIVNRMTAMMNEQLVDQSLCEWVTPNFTTTTPIDRTVCAVVMMGTTKDDSARPFALQCGIPKVTLEGEKKDWETILNRLERLKMYGIRTIAWYHLLRPILSRFVTAYEHPDHLDNLEFWNKIAHTHSVSTNGPEWLSGWITAFCVFNAQGQWQGNTLNEERIREHEPKKLLRRADPLQLTPSHFATVYTIRVRSPYLTLDGFPYPTIACGDVPCGYARLDMWLDDARSSGYGREIGRRVEAVEMIAGAVGAQICSTDKTELFRNGMRDTLRPVSAWWCLVKRKGEVGWAEGEMDVGSDGTRTSILSTV